MTAHQLRRRASNIAAALRCAPATDAASVPFSSSSSSSSPPPPPPPLSSSPSRNHSHAHPFYRVLAADVTTAADWLHVKQLACTGGAIKSTANFGVGTTTPLAETKESGLLKFSDRFDQLVLSMTLVGRDVVGNTAQMMKAAELGTTSGSRRSRRRLANATTTTTAIMKEGATNTSKVQSRTSLRRHDRRNSSRRRLSSDGEFPVDAASAWAAPSAANIGPLVECLERDGFQLVNREQTYDRAYDDAREMRLGIPPPKYTAAMTFVVGAGSSEGGGVLGHQHA